MDDRRQKPEGARAGWKMLGSATRFENDIFRVREDEVELADGKEIKYAYVERDEAVVIVPVTDDGQMVLLRQYRYPVDEWCLEIPAGGTHDTGDEALEEVAKKELREEIGGKVRALTYVDFFYSTSSLTDEKCHVFIAEGVELSREPKTEESEEIKIELVPIERALEIVRSGAMKTGPCALAVLLCEEQLRQLGRHRPTPDHQLET
jgi:ADP-ribose pyrophosphatase